MYNNICLIPARSGSKRIPNKNYKDFLGKPIIQYAIDFAIGCSKKEFFEKIIISTDDDRIKLMVKDKYLNIDLHDRTNANDDNATTFDVFKLVKDELNIDSKYWTVIYPTSVFCKKEWIRNAYEKLEKKDSQDCCFAIIKDCQPNNKKLFKSEQTDKISVCNYRAHDDQGNNFFYYHASQFFIFKQDEILKSGKIVQQCNEYIEINQFEAIDINTENDWIIAEKLYKLNNT